VGGCVHMQFYTKVLNVYVCSCIIMQLVLVLCQPVMGTS